jgi:hypothetical protein
LNDADQAGGCLCTSVDCTPHKNVAAGDRTEYEGKDNEDHEEAVHGVTSHAARGGAVIAVYTEVGSAVVTDLESPRPKLEPLALAEDANKFFFPQRSVPFEEIGQCLQSRSSVHDDRQGGVLADRLGMGLGDSRREWTQRVNHLLQPQLVLGCDSPEGNADSEERIAEPSKN